MLNTESMPPLFRPTINIDNLVNFIPELPRIGWSDEQPLARIDSKSYHYLAISLRELFGCGVCGTCRSLHLEESPLRATVAGINSRKVL